MTHYHWVSAVITSYHHSALLPDNSIKALIDSRSHRSHWSGAAVTTGSSTGGEARAAALIRSRCGAWMAGSPGPRRRRWVLATRWRSWTVESHKGLFESRLCFFFFLPSFVLPQSRDVFMVAHQTVINLIKLINQSILSPF